VNEQTITIEKLEEMEAKKERFTYEVEIIDIETVQRGELFKGRTRKPELNSALLWFNYNNEKRRTTLNIPKGLVYDREKGEWVITDVEGYKRSTRMPNSMWSRFRQVYGIPKIGTKFKVFVTEKGFFQVAL